MSVFEAARATPWRRSLLACGLGALTVAAFAPFQLFFLPLLTLAWLIRAWHRAANARAAGWLGFCFGLGLYLAGVSWVYISLHQFGGMPMPLALAGTLGFCALSALFPALAGWGYRRLRPLAEGAGAVVLAAACWTLVDWAREWVLTGFPWLALGYSQAPPSPLAGYAPLFGVFGLSFLLALLAARLGLGSGWLGRWLPGGLVVLAVVAAGAGLRQVEWTQPREGSVSVSLLQGNIEQSLKWRPDLLYLSLDTYLQLAREHPAQLVILPEAALPMALQDVPPEYLAALRRTVAPGGGLLFGVVSYEADERYFNSAMLYTDDGAGRYDKSHLVPFGEFIPPAFGWVESVLQIPMSSFTRGAPAQAPLSVAGERLAVNICYEDVFGPEIARALPGASILVNLSNTAWFGDSLAQPQHLQIAQLRALETGRPMLRATNTGMTAVVAPNGEVSQRLPPFTAGVLRAQVRGYEGLTPFVRWGNWPVVALAGLILAVAAALRARKG